MIILAYKHDQVYQRLLAELVKFTSTIKNLPSRALDLYLSLRRKKSLNLLLYIALTMIAREGISISGGNSAYFLGILNLIETPVWWQTAVLTVLSVVFYAGNYVLLTVYVVLFIFIGILKWGELWLVRVQNDRVNDSLRERVKTLEEQREIDNENRRLIESGFNTEQNKLLDSLKRRGISTQRLIQKYDKPLRAILISYMKQRVQTSTGEVVHERYASHEFRAQGAISLGGSELIIPPTKFPENVKTRDDLKEWYEENILKGRYLKLKFLAIIDLREKIYWSNNVPEAGGARGGWKHSTIGEALNIDELFSEEAVNRIALSDIVRDGDIVWLASASVGTDTLHWIQQNQIGIENAIGNPNLRTIAKGDLKNNLIDELKTRLSRDEATEVAEAIITEAQYWQTKLV